MNFKRRKTFFEWYAKHKDDILDCQKDLLTYCISDVHIL